MYKCTDCGKEYEHKPDYCDCGNTEFKVIGLLAQPDKVSVSNRDSNSGTTSRSGATVKAGSSSRSDYKDYYEQSEEEAANSEKTVFIIILTSIILLGIGLVFLSVSQYNAHKPEVTPEIEATRPAEETSENALIVASKENSATKDAQPVKEQKFEDTLTVLAQQETPSGTMQTAQPVQQTTTAKKTVSSTQNSTTNKRTASATTKPAQSTQTTKSSQPQQPAQPAQSTQTTKPPQPQQPAQPAQSTQTTKPSQPQQPAQPAQSTQTTKPSQPQQPAQPALAEQQKTAAEAAKAAQKVLEQQKKELSQYKIALRNKITSDINFTRVTGDGSCVISFKIDSTGKLTNRAFAKQSQNDSLNDAVYAAIMQNPMYNIPPAGYKNETLKLSVKIVGGNFEVALN